MSLKRFWNFRKVNASQMTTAVEDGGRLVRFDEATRVVYSREIRWAARPQLVFPQFATRKTELGVTRGRTIAMLRMNDIKAGGPLVEGTPMVTTTISGSERQITVQEYGNAIAYSELLLQTSFLPTMSIVVTELARDYAMVLNMEMRDVLSTLPNALFAHKHATAVPGSPVTGNNVQRADLDATSFFDISLVNDGLEFLTMQLAPPFGTNEYICLLHPHQERQIRDDMRNFVMVSQYAQPGEQFFGEVGRIDNVRFIRTGLMLNGALPTDQLGNSYRAYLAANFAGDDDNPATGTVPIYQAVLFGMGVLAWAVALPVELRDNGVIDFQREHQLGWYAIWGTALLRENWGVRLESA